MIWVIPSGFYGRLLTKCGILKKHLVIVEAGVIDSDYRGEVSALLFNQHSQKLLPLEKVIELHRLFLWKNLLRMSKGWTFWLFLV